MLREAATGVFSKLCEASLPLMKTLCLAHCATHNSLNRTGGPEFNPGRELFSTFSQISPTANQWKILFYLFPQ